MTTNTALDPANKPNILYIMADEAIAELMGAYDHPVVKTPNIDKLVENGVRFDTAYTPFPLCAPGRAAMMTGRHASSIGAWDNAAPFGSDIPTFAHYLAQNGYDTVLSGKMHFVGADQLHGFARRLNTDIYPADFDWTRPEWVAMKESKGEDWRNIMENRSKYNASNYAPDAVKIDAKHGPLTYDEETHFRAKQYLNARGNNPEPFLLTVSYHHPHEPFWPPKKYWDMYEGEQIDIPELPDDLEDRQSMMDVWLNAYHGVKRYDLQDKEGLYRLRRAYYALMTYMDDLVGELLETLEETGLDENTIVVFSSDHGDMLAEREMVQKRAFYDFCSRVPLIVKYPDNRNAGTVVDTPVTTMDLLPTFCEMTGSNASQPFDGDSLIPLFENENPDRHVFVQAHEVVGVPCIMVRKGDWKYNYIHGHAPQLFNMKDDPKEWDNLAGTPENSEIETELKALILDEFDPDDIAAENLASIRRRAVIKEVMDKQGVTWTHYPEFDARKNALEQHLP
jgi:choline-sulfatase